MTKGEVVVLILQFLRLNNLNASFTALLNEASSQWNVAFPKTESVRDLHEILNEYLALLEGHQSRRELVTDRHVGPEVQDSIRRVYEGMDELLKDYLATRQLLASQRGGESDRDTDEATSPPSYESPSGRAGAGAGAGAGEGEGAGAGAGEGAGAGAGQAGKQPADSGDPKSRRPASAIPQQSPPAPQPLQPSQHAPSQQAPSQQAPSQQQPLQQQLSQQQQQQPSQQQFSTPKVPSGRAKAAAAQVSASYRGNKKIVGADMVEETNMHLIHSLPSFSCSGAEGPAGSVSAAVGAMAEELKRRDGNGDGNITSSGTAAASSGDDKGAAEVHERTGLSNISFPDLGEQFNHNNHTQMNSRFRDPLDDQDVSLADISDGNQPPFFDYDNNKRSNIMSQFSFPDVAVYTMPEANKAGDVAPPAQAQPPLHPPPQLLDPTIKLELSDPTIKLELVPRQAPPTLAQEEQAAKGNNAKKRRITPTTLSTGRPKGAPPPPSRPTAGPDML